MGKFCAAAITAIIIAWLGPMCASLPANKPIAAAPEPAPVPSPALAPEPAPVVSSATPMAAPVTASPAVPAHPAGEQVLVLSNYRFTKPFPSSNVEKGRLRIPLYRENRAAVTIVDARLILIARHEGVEIDRAEGSLPPALAPGSTGYYTLTLSSGAVERILDAPVDAGDELDWELTYRLEGSDEWRCFRLRALPRRGVSGGIDWVHVDSSRVCPE